MIGLRSNENLEFQKFKKVFEVFTMVCENIWKTLGNKKSSFKFQYYILLQIHLIRSYFHVCVCLGVCMYKHMCRFVANLILLFCFLFPT